jgi:cellulose synthase/poly-beta-1,6-N-acetylglucosamine synthase-like glycosyltransferase
MMKQDNDRLTLLVIAGLVLYGTFLILLPLFVYAPGTPLGTQFALPIPTGTPTVEWWVILYVIAQILYLGAFTTVFWFLSLKVNWVDSSKVSQLTPGQMPLIVLAYPVLHEDEDTMHSTMLALSRMDYPPDKYRVIAIPNSHDTATIAALRRLQTEFPFLEILEVPPTDDPSWNTVWRSWETCPYAYWWHQGKTQNVTDLPAKKTRQLIYLFYTLVDRMGTDWVLDYIDADSLTPPNHFKLAAVGLQQYDVLQSTNVVGNLLDTFSTSLHASDHMGWDGYLYPHMSANGKHPYYVLGKGLFYKAGDLYTIGGFNPWIAIEDPEVGIRLWSHGKRLGIIAEPLIEESPQHFFMGGIVQRNRWMLGFFQTMNSSLKYIKLNFWQRQRARLNMVPVLSFLVNIIGLPTGAYALYRFIEGTGVFSLWIVVLSLINILLYVSFMTLLYRNVWRRTRYVLQKRRDRAFYLLRINPISLFVYWFLWCIPIIIGFSMFIADKGKSWARTHKVDANHEIAERPVYPSPVS